MRFDDLQIGETFVTPMGGMNLRMYEKKSLSSAFLVDPVQGLAGGYIRFTAAVKVYKVTT